MAPIQKASSALPPPPKGPTLGSLQPPTDLTLHGTKAAGLGNHTASRAVKGDYRSRMATASEEDMHEGLLSDYMQLHGVSDELSEKLTIHAATSHLQDKNEALSFSPAQRSEFRSLLNKQRPRILEKHALASNAYVVSSLLESTWFSGQANLAQTELEDLPIAAPPPAALQRPFVNLPNELAPQSASEESRLFLLMTDPRSGYAPEGVAAWVAWCRYGLQLERSHEETYDFIDSESRHGWHVAPAREDARRPIAEIQCAASSADEVNAHLLVDATRLPQLDGALPQLEGALGVAIRELAASASKTRILVVLGPIQLVPTR